MGRMVACRKCGAWGEVAPEAPPGDWLCEACRGGEPAIAAQPHSEPPAPPSHGDSAAPRPQGEPATPPAPAGHRPQAIGHDSGDIGAASFGAAPDGLKRQVDELRAAVQGITIGTADLGEDRHALPETGLDAEHPAAVPDEVLPDGVPVLEQDADADVLSPPRLGPEGRTPHAPRAAKWAVPVPDPVGSVSGRRRPASGAAPAAKREAMGSRRCGVCSEAVIPGDRAVTCPRCGAVYHVGCYGLVNHCVSEECRRQAAKRPLPPAAGAEAEPLPLSRPPAERIGRRCQVCGAAVSSKALVCPKCGRWLYTGRAHPAQRGDSAQSQSQTGCAVALMVALLLLFLFLSRA